MIQRVASLRVPNKKATLMFLVKNGKVLLAMKKRGFGKGRYNGVGGKREKGEGIDDTAVRETKEEVGATAKKFHLAAKPDFYFLGKREWDQQVLVYVCDKWDGRPRETEEMKPEWFDVRNLPYDKMWSDDPLWLPHVLSEKYVRAKFIFDDKEGVRDYIVKVSGKKL